MITSKTNVFFYLDSIRSFEEKEEKEEDILKNLQKKLPNLPLLYWQQNKGSRENRKKVEFSNQGPLFTPPKTKKVENFTLFSILTASQRIGITLRAVMIFQISWTFNTTTTTGRSRRLKGI